MFWLTHLAASLVMPLTLVVLALVAAVVLSWFPGRRRPARLLVTGATALLVLAAMNPFPARQIRRAERATPRFDLQAVDPALRARIRYVAVLGSGHSSDPALPMSSKLGGAALSRIVEGVVVLRQLPGTALIVTGGRIYDPKPHAEVMRDMALALGVAPERIVADPLPMSTDEEAGAIRARVGGEPFVLVTSALHMPRALRAFRASGMHPIPAPTEHSREPAGFSLDALFPSAGRIMQTQSLLYEILGTLWQRLTGRG